MATAFAAAALSSVNRAARLPSLPPAKESHTKDQVGSHKEGIPPNAWTGSGLTPALRESSKQPRKGRSALQASAGASAR
jgi:hypothetical protein